MPSSLSEVVAKVKKYIDQLKREDRIRHALSRLEKIDMTLDILRRTQVGKAVNGLCNHDTYGDDALRIVTRWKEIARKNGIIPQRKSSSDEDEHSEDSGDDEPRRSRKRSASPAPPQRKAIKVEVKEEPYSPPPSSSTSSSSKSGTKVKVVKKEEDAFSRMLSTADTGVARAKKPKSLDWKDDDIDTNYRPFPAHSVSKSIAKVDEPFNPERMFRPRKDRQKVFAGRRKGPGLTEVPTLFNCCMRVIGNNIDAIEETGDIPYDILRPVLEKCSPQQLEYIELKNPYLEEDSNELWERFFTKAFPGKRLHPGETHKEAYFRQKQESEERLKMLSSRIGNSHKAEETSGQRKTMIAEATAPLSIRKRQMKHGLAYTKAALPSASEISKARKKIFETGSSKSLASIPTAVINRTSTVGSKKDTKKPVVKKGALMMKTLKMLNMKRR